MRYVGQGHEITVPLPLRALTGSDVSMLRATFEREYAALFRRAIPGAAIEALSWSVRVSTTARRPAPIAPVGEGRASAPAGARALFDGRAGGLAEVPLYRRAALGPGMRIAGPALIAEDETSTYISASFAAHIDASGCIVMDRKDA